MYNTASLWFLLILVPSTNELEDPASCRDCRSVSGVANVSSSAAAVLTSPNFTYGIINGQSQLSELKALVKKVDELHRLVNTRFFQLTNKMDVLKIETLYGERVNRLRWFLHKKSELFQYNKNGTLRNVPQIKRWADAVLSHGIHGIDNLLFDLHNMAMGNSGVFSSRPVAQIYRERVIFDTESESPCTDLKAFIEFLTALQADGYATWAAAVNFRGSLQSSGVGRGELQASKILLKGNERLSMQARLLGKIEILPPSKLGIDAALRHTNGRTYFFRGNKYWRYNDKEERIDPGYPKDISDHWDGLPPDIDAAFTWRKWPLHPWKIYFFKGDHFYSYTEKHGLSEKSPISRGWAGMSGNINGVFNFRYEITPGVKARTTYFVKGNNLYRHFRFREKLKSVGTIGSKWSGMSGPIDSVFLWSNNMWYFFKGEQYYKYNDKGQRIGRPRSLDFWRGLC